jgi:MFS transporter, UMF1 family
MQTASKKVVNAWAMYDWANSAYNLVITSTIFPAYFEAVTGDGNEATKGDTINFLGRDFVNTSLYNYALAFALLMVALVSPLLSSIADYRGNKKNFLNFFLTIGSLACAAMFFFQGKADLVIGIACMIVACIGYWASVVFYNSFLPEIAAPQDRDRISAKGFAYGYVGSVILQIICFVFVFMPGLVGGYDDKVKGTSNIQFQVCFLLVGIWWWGFGQFSLRRLPKPIPAGTGDQRHILSKGYLELKKVWAQIKKISLLKRYLVSFFFFSMGLQTVMLVAALYGKEELAIPVEKLIPAIIIIQLIAIPGALVLSWLSSKIGNLRSLIAVVCLWILLCVAGYLLPVGGVYEFWALAAAVGFVMGGTQSLSRSTYSKFMPETKDTASFFSFYDVTEKIAAVIGIFSFGFITELTGSQRGSVLALITFFIIGLGLLWYTKKSEIRNLPAGR